MQAAPFRTVKPLPSIEIPLLLGEQTSVISGDQIQQLRSLSQRRAGRELSGIFDALLSGVESNTTDDSYSSRTISLLLNLIDLCPRTERF